MKPPAPTTRLAVAPPAAMRRNTYLPTRRGPTLVHTPPARKDSSVKAAWILILVGLAIACIPGIGFSIYLLSFPISLAVFILGIIAASRGRAGHGVLLIFSSFVSFGLFLLIPWIFGLLGLAVAAATSPP